MTQLYYSDRFLDHDAGPRHPERPERLAVLRDRLLEPPPGTPSYPWKEPKPASAVDCARAHTAGYLAQLEAVRGTRAQLDPDTAVSPGSLEAAYLAAGAAIQAAEAVLSGDHESAFALVRPPGHHAEADRAMGFCLLANVAIASATALARGDVERILVIDWDVHHGNGTQHIFENRKDVLFFSCHRGGGFYPGTGRLGEVGHGDGVGFTVNAPLPAGGGDALYADLFRRVLAPIAEAYRPQLILVSAGFDAHRRDPLGGMKVSDSGFGTLCGIVQEIADRQTEGRLALVLEGGYDLEGLVGGVDACLHVLAGTGAPRGRESPESPPPSASERKIVDRIRAHHSQHWPDLRASA